MNVRPRGINRNKLKWLLEQPVDVKLEILGHHLELCRLLINEILDEEVTALSGDRYSHHKPHNGRYSRWGYNPGSVRIGNERIRVDVPRVYDNQRRSNISLENYRRLRHLPEADERVMKAILLGLSTGDYQEVVQQMLDSFGLSRSSISQKFIEVSSEKLKAFEERDLSGHHFVAIFIDGKYLAKEQIVIALGVTQTGEKIPLGFVQTHTENANSIGQLLKDLLSRGLNVEQGILFVIDGSKGILKAIKEVIGDYAVIQRCQWHKRENIVNYLNENQQEHFRRKLNKAYNEDNYEAAKERLMAIKVELESINHSAARSLQEGLEQSLTLHRLGLIETFRRSFTTTNCIENLNSQLTKYIGKVKHWKSSPQRYRWIAAALLEIEQRMNRVSNYKKIYELQEKLKEETEKRAENKKVTDKKKAQAA